MLKSGKQLITHKAAQTPLNSVGVRIGQLYLKSGSITLFLILSGSYEDQAYH